jgi:hypothetical protein
VNTYFSKNPTLPFLSYEDYTRNFFPPNSPAIRQLYQAAEYSPWNEYGYSNWDRYEREMQSVSVEVGEKVAFDWTFQAVKNYRNLPGAKAIFTGNKGSTKEIISLAIVGSTAVSQVSHQLVQQIKTRQNFHPSVLYSDTWLSRSSRLLS